MTKYGFNMLWMFSHGYAEKKGPDLRQLDFIAKNGFNFIRVPLDYRFWTPEEGDYQNPDESVLAMIDTYLSACRERGLHMSLNIHRAPGYCINKPPERHNLWTDKAAQDGFAFLWEYFAKKYKSIANEHLSFDLLNEPPDPGENGFTRKRHEKVMRQTISAIRAIDPAREIVLNGICGGSDAIPELSDTGTIHSGRGYTPFTVSHHRAEWVSGYEWQTPSWPCTEEGERWNKEALREHYRPWRDVEAKGVKIHMGEFGCYNKTPNDVALAWLSDLLGVWHEFGWGYALWNFAGPFGVVDHKRPGAKFEKIDGFNIDRALWELLLNNRK